MRRDRMRRLPMLDRKVLRDLLHLKGQLAAVALLVACGVAVFIMLRSMNGYLRSSQASYYAEDGFGDAFAHVTRAPAAVEGEIAALPGVAAAYTRLVSDVLLDLPGLDEPATGRLVSLPDRGDPPLHRLHLREGRLPEPGRRDEVVVSAAFARANGMHPGDGFGAVLGGRWERLRIVGTAISPEFVYEIRGFGQVFPDNRRFGALWMSRSAMEGAFEMGGAFNDVVVDLLPGTAEAPALAALDRALERYGGGGAYGRDQHPSHAFLQSEIDETTITASFFPTLFLVITAFLLHTTLLRLVTMEREQIGLLKAFGFSSAAVASHYLKLALAPVAAGAAAGAALGAVSAGRLAGVYARFYQFPSADFELDPGVVAVALAIAAATGVVGALAAARSAVGLHPAIAMRPPAPPVFRASALERTRLWKRMSPPSRIVVRSVARAGWKSAATVVGLALSLGVLGALLSMYDSVDLIERIQFQRVQREDVAVFFEGPRPRAAVAELGRLPGVLRVEPFRSVPVRLRHGSLERRAAVLGMEPGTELRRIVDARERVHATPVAGVLMSRMLAARLDLRPGDRVRVEVTEGDRPAALLPVAGLVDELVGAEVYMDLAELRALLREPPTVSGAWLTVDPRAESAVYDRLKRMPAIGGVLVRDVALAGFRDTIAESFSIALAFTLVFGGGLVVAIVYNAARIALSERGRELASLRVLGFSRREVASMLLGEQALLVIAAVPLGLALAYLLTVLMMSRFASDVFRLPVTAVPETYALATVVVLAAAALSALLVRRRLDRMDLMAVLKTRE